MYKALSIVLFLVPQILQAGYEPIKPTDPVNTPRVRGIGAMQVQQILLTIAVFSVEQMEHASL